VPRPPGGRLRSCPPARLRRASSFTSLHRPPGVRGRAGGCAHVHEDELVRTTIRLNGHGSTSARNCERAVSCVSAAGRFKGKFLSTLPTKPPAQSATQEDVAEFMRRVAGLDIANYPHGGGGRRLVLE
jgi:hypothetical protein